ncbi:MAG: hypothetical protein JSV22_04875, partial [Bacteroidales bacterium]
VDTGELTIFPGEEYLVTIDYMPTVVAEDTASLFIESDDAFNPLTEVILIGSAVSAPVISVTPGSFDIELYTGDEITEILGIGNESGGSELTWNSRFVNFQSSENISTIQLNEQSTAINNNNIEINTGIQGTFPLAHGIIIPKSSSPVPLTCVTSDPETGIIYAQENQGHQFFQYDPSTDIWTALADCPMHSGNNGGATCMNGKIYTCYTNNYIQLGKYDIASNTWGSELNYASTGTGNITNDGHYIYIADSNSLWRCYPPSDTWIILAYSPVSFQKWGGISYYNQKIYGHTGDGTNGFAIYDLVSDTWSTGPDLPSGAVLGCAIDSVNEIYYAYGSYGNSNLYAYDIQNNFWSINTILPFNINDGGMAHVIGDSSGVYIVQGEYTTGFVLYKTGQPWIRLEPESGIVENGNTQNTNLIINASSLSSGNYGTDLIISSNDPVNPEITVPVSLNVKYSADILPLGNSITFDAYPDDPRPDGDKTSYRYKLYELLNNANYSFDFIGSENSGFNYFPDGENAGFPGMRDDQMTYLLQTGYNLVGSIQETPGPYLETYSPDIILLHAGTNGLDNNPGDIESMLDEIDAFEISSGKDIKVFVAEIINRQTYSLTTTEFNNNVAQMISLRNDDDVFIVDMEFGAGIDYGSDMRDYLHPLPSGYDKMGYQWFKAVRHLWAPHSIDPVIVSSPKDTAYKDHPYYFNVEARGEGLLKFTLAESPDGMTIDPGTGIITWLPIRFGTFPVKVVVRNQDIDTDTLDYSLVIIDAPVPGYCQNEYLTENSGTISDNSGENNYQNNMSCEKIIELTVAATITLTFTAFDTESGYDIVTVYDGNDTSDPVLGTFSGSSLPPVLTSSDRRMLIVFTSDHSITRQGWEAVYTSAELGECINETFTDIAGIVDDNSLAGDYKNNADCYKLIQPPNATDITLTFTEFDTEPVNDVVTVYDGDDIGDPVLGAFSGTAMPPVLTSTGGSMLIHFTSNEIFTESGWSAGYTCTQEYQGPCIDETFTALTGRLSDNSGPEPYTNNMNCEKLIQPVGAVTIT